MKWFAVFCLLGVPSAFAMPESPRGIVEGIFAKAGSKEVATNMARQAEVNNQVDFSILAKSALGKHYASLSPKEFDWFNHTLQEIITLTVYPKAPDFLKGVQINYDSVQEKGDKALVKSTVQNKADITEVNYTLQKDKGGGWKVIDVSIAGQSWVESIRDQVGKVIKKKKWQGLKDSMNRRLHELKAEA